MRGWVVLPWISLLAGFPELSAQELTTLVPGSRIRVTSPECFGEASPMIGKYHSLRSDTLWVLASKHTSPSACAVPLISRVEVVKDHRARDALLLGLLGGGIGAVALGLHGGDYATKSGDDDWVTSPTWWDSRDTKKGALIGAFVGVFFGVTMGVGFQEVSLGIPEAGGAVSVGYSIPTWW